MAQPFHWRNPPLWFRVIVVALAIAMPGTLAGMMTALFLGSAHVNGLIGALLGATGGLVLELWPVPSESLTTQGGDELSGQRLRECEAIAIEAVGRPVPIDKYDLPTA